MKLWTRFYLHLDTCRKRVNVPVTIAENRIAGMKWVNPHRNTDIIASAMMYHHTALTFHDRSSWS